MAVLGIATTSALTAHAQPAPDTQPPPPPERKYGRNHNWTHLYNADVLSMPDKWEFPWYASWDMSFHCVAMALIDPNFAK